MTAMLNAQAATVLARALADSASKNGMQVVISPGSRSTPLCLAFEALEAAQYGAAQHGAAQPRLAQCHVVLDERAAGFVALGIARSSGQAAVLLCTSGSAGTHYLPAIVEARQARVPLLVITADRPAEQHHVGSAQTISQERLFGEHVLKTFNLPAPSTDLPMPWLRSIAIRAQILATGSPAGPVHINAPFREPLWEPSTIETGRADASHTEDGLEDTNRKIIFRGPRRLNDEQLAELATRLDDHKRGVIVCGPHAPATNSARKLATAVAQLSRKLGFPILADPASGLRYGMHDLENVMASSDALLRQPGLAHRLAPSVVLRFGQIPTSKATNQWLAQHAAGRTILFDADGDWHDAGSGADAIVVADPQAVCTDLRRHVDDRSDTEWINLWRHADRTAAAVLDAHTAQSGWEGAIAAQVIRALPDGSQIHLASSMPIRDVDSFSGCRRANVVVHANRGCNGIDGVVATIIGEAIAHSRGPTAALIGDLSLLHDLDGLEAASHLTVRATLVVIHNGGGRIFSHLPIASHPTALERFFVTPRTADIGGICRAMGLKHRAVAAHDQADFDQALRDDLERDGLGIIEIRVDHKNDLAERERTWKHVAQSLLSHTQSLPVDRLTQENRAGKPTAQQNRSRT